eukprot:4629586-Pyramimonas_sp.AAC.1
MASCPCGGLLSLIRLAVAQVFMFDTVLDRPLFTREFQDSYYHHSTFVASRVLAEVRMLVAS